MSISHGLSRGGRKEGHRPGIVLLICLARISLSSLALILEDIILTPEFLLQSHREISFGGVHHKILRVGALSWIERLL